MTEKEQRILTELLEKDRGLTDRERCVLTRLLADSACPVFPEGVGQCEDKEEAPKASSSPAPDPAEERPLTEDELVGNLYESLFDAPPDEDEPEDEEPINSRPLSDEEYLVGLRREYDQLLIHNHLLSERNRALEKALKSARAVASAHAAAKSKALGEKARNRGLAAGVGLSLTLTPAVCFMASLGWRLLNWLCDLASITPELFLSALCTSLAGLALLRCGKRCADWWTGLFQADDIEDDLCYDDDDDEEV